MLAVDAIRIPTDIVAKALPLYLGAYGPRSGAGWFRNFDIIAAQTSAGKDSQTALRAAVRAAKAAGVLNRVVVMHVDLGPRVEWPRVPELAREQAARHRLPLLICRRGGADLLEDIRTRRTRTGALRGWPGAGLRYCTSDHKTAPARAAIEALCERMRADLGRPVRVLQVLGFRAGESKRRADAAAWSFNVRQSAMSKRLVWDWLPIQGMTTADVWADIRASGVPYHPAYDEGMSRLSCRFCILARRRDLSIARRLAPDVAADYIAAEVEMGHTFQNGRALSSIEPEPGPTGLELFWTGCPACRCRVLTSTRRPVAYCPAHATAGPWNNPDADDTPGCGAADNTAEYAPDHAADRAADHAADVWAAELTTT